MCPPSLIFGQLEAGKLDLIPTCTPEVKVSSSCTALLQSPRTNNVKVCLSLLGTWTGSPEEQWQPGKSTLLSVLVSIQAMIFCENPWENEPGNENDAAASSSGRTASEMYNQEIQSLTTRYAILDWLREPTMRDSVWSHVLTQYFSHHREKIMQKIRTWAVSNRKITGWECSVGRVNLVTELAAALGFTTQRGQN